MRASRLLFYLSEGRRTTIGRRDARTTDLIEECGHPRHASLNLKVTPISGCDGFEPAMQVH